MLLKSALPVKLPEAANLWKIKGDFADHGSPTSAPSFFLLDENKLLVSN